MSMILALTTLGDANIARVLAFPPLVWRVLAPDQPEAYEEAAAAASAPSLWGRLMGQASPSRSGADDFALAEGEGVTTDIDKAWHGLHYLFTGTADGGAPPLDFLLVGGKQVGNIDVGYGPARALSASATRAAHEALVRLDAAGRRARFDPAAMTRLEIYPEIWTPSAADEDDPLGYLVEHAAILKAFLAKAVRGNHGLLIHLS